MKVAAKSLSFIYMRSFNNSEIIRSPLWLYYPSLTNNPLLLHTKTRQFIFGSQLNIKPCYFNAINILKVNNLDENIYKQADRIPTIWKSHIIIMGKNVLWLARKSSWLTKSIQLYCCSFFSNIVIGLWLPRVSITLITWVLTWIFSIFVPGTLNK